MFANLLNYEALVRLYSAINVACAMNVAQARKAVDMAEIDGRIKPSWRVGRNLEYHTPEASRIEVSFNGRGLIR